MMEIREFYEHIGQDYGVVLNRMMGKESFTAMLLGTFLKDKTMEALEAAVKNGNAQEVFEQAHTFKGLAANLGLKPLYDETAPLVEIARRGSMEGVDEAFGKVKAVYGEMVNLLKNVNLAG